MGRKLLEIAYLGACYCGWQVQPNGITVQQVLQDALEKILKHRPDVTGCSRTDSGVHAKSFFCHFDIDVVIPNEGLVLGLNTALPSDIAALRAFDVDDNFHARYSSLGKTYCYRFYEGPIRDPFTQDRKLLIKQKIDMDKASEFCDLLIGKHDFAAFSSIHRTVKDTVRTVYECYILKNDNEYEFVVHADGFLYNMVRIMVGSLFDYSAGKITKNDVIDAFLQGERNKLGITAPPHGLYLEKVHYSNDF